MNMVWLNRVLLASLLTSAFTFFMIYLPTLIQEVAPCLKNLPGVSYNYQDCNAVGILDRYILMALSGFTILILLLFIQYHNIFISKSLYKNISKLNPGRILLGLMVLVIIPAMIGGTIIIMSYYRFSTAAMKSAARAPIILESLKK